MSGKKQLQEHEVLLDCDNSCVAVLPCTIAECRCSCCSLAECVNVRVGAGIACPII